MTGKSTYKIPCPYCSSYATLVDSSAVYSRSYGMIYLCAPCDAYVGVHKHSHDYRPLGTPANSELREARKKAHQAFDRLWLSARDRTDARHQAYKIMQELMNLSPDEAHIGLFTVAQCHILIHLVTPLKQLT